MVKFCNSCKRAVDDLDKFCRSCGHGTDDSIDYHTYYRFFIKEKNDQQHWLWFMQGKDIAIRQEIKEIKEKVDIMYQKLFPPSVGELREDFDRVFEKKEDNTVRKPSEITIEKKDEHKEEHKEDNHAEKSSEIAIEKKEEHREEKIEEKPEKPPEKPPEKKEEHKEEKIEEKPEKPPEKKEKKIDEEQEDNTVNPNIDNHNIISTTEFLENKDINEKFLIESSDEKENWPWPEETIGEEIGKKQNETEVHQEVNDKLDTLLQVDEGQRQAVQFLINKYASKNKSKKIDDNINNNRYDNQSSVNVDNGPSIAIIPSEDVVRNGRARGKGKEKGEPYKMYDGAIHPFIPDILKSIESSKDGMIRVRLLDIAKKMGNKFIDKKPVTIYTGLKYTLFDHKIVVEMGSLKDVDPVTKENIKILKMRMKNPDDTLPPSLLERRGEME